VTSVDGAVRLITLTKMFGGDEVMRGAVLTQIDRDAHYIPSISAIVLTKLRGYQPGGGLPVEVAVVHPDLGQRLELKRPILQPSTRTTLPPLSEISRAEPPPFCTDFLVVNYYEWLSAAERVQKLKSIWTGLVRLSSRADHRTDIVWWILY
jgi:hypothetical protein